jgi:hypothetical protein
MSSVEVSGESATGTPLVNAGEFSRFHGPGRAPGPAPEHNTCGSFAAFADPDGNGWLLQEITTRLPGR